MSDADIFVIHQDKNQWTCTDLVSTHQGRPDFDTWYDDGQNNCQLVLGNPKANELNSSIKRPLPKSEAYDKDLAEGNVSFIWAYNKDLGVFHYHGDKTRGSAKLLITKNQTCHSSCVAGCNGPFETDCKVLCAVNNCTICASNNKCQNCSVGFNLTTNGTCSEYKKPDNSTFAPIILQSLTLIILSLLGVFLMI